MADWEFDYIVNTYKWADGFTPVKTTKLTKLFGNGFEWGFLYMFTGGFGFGLIAMVILWLICGESWAGLTAGAVMLAPVMPLQIMAEIARNKLDYNREINNRTQLNLFRDFDLK